MLGCIVANSGYPGVQEQVVWLDVSVDKAQLMDGVDGQHSLCYVELSSFFCQGVLLHQKGHHVTYGTTVKINNV